MNAADGERGGEEPPKVGGHQPERDLRAVLSEHADRLLSIEGVAGIAEGVEAGEPVVVVLTIGELARTSRRRIPARLEGYAIVIRRTGSFEALSG